MPKIFWWILGIIILIGIAPILSVVIAGTIASTFDCRLDEGSVHQCIVYGQDIGGTLYTMAVLGWLAIATVPLAFGGLVLWVVALVVTLTIKSRSKRIL